MRRTMPALLLTAIFVAPAAAQFDSSAVNGSAPVAPASSCGCGNGVGNGPVPVPMPMTGCGNGTGSQLAAYMNCYPNHPCLWASYPAERAARLNHQFYHFNGCDCLDPKRHLHSHPSVIGGCGSGCDVGACDNAASGGQEVAIASPLNRYKLANAGSFSTLHGQTSGTPEKLTPMANLRLMPPSLPIATRSWSTLGPVAKPASSDVTVSPLR